MFPSQLDFPPYQGLIAMHKSIHSDPIVQEILDEILQMTDPNLEQYLHLIESFLHTAAESVQEIQVALQQADYQNLWHAAHGLKPMSAMFGAMDLHDLSRTAEEMGRTLQVEGLPMVVAQIVQEFERVQLALQAEIEKKLAPHGDASLSA